MEGLPRIVTVTLNSAIDQSVFVDALHPGAVHRVQRSQLQAGGKGLNVATMLALGRTPATVSGFLGEGNAGIFEAHFMRYQLVDAFIRIPGETRVGIKVLDTLHGTTDFNFSGLCPDAAAMVRLRETLGALAGPDVWFVFGGSLPEGLEVESYRELLCTLMASGARVIVDSSGVGLRTAIDVGVHVIKPNELELIEALSLEDQSPATLYGAVDRLLQRGLETVVLSMGKAGALFAQGGRRLLAQAPELEVISTVGAGDALLAGYLAACTEGRSLEDAARLATVYAWSRLTQLEPDLPDATVRDARMQAVAIQSVG
ncbi:1-phosphofructokinase [Coraliomargarita akajimensis DSM 45221]|uniref:1-phosphofructokinase n=2 Tax=Coraliomargarita TaxID=442430 RepID=D5EIW5_CORAD|nr:1-phosphofructokinase [Coraliomargarita akajimensis DSM 45221]